MPASRHNSRRSAGIIVVPDEKTTNEGAKFFIIRRTSYVTGSHVTSQSSGCFHREYQPGRCHKSMPHACNSRRRGCKGACASTLAETRNPLSMSLIAVRDQSSSEPPQGAPDIVEINTILLFCFI